MEPCGWDVDLTGCPAAGVDADPAQVDLAVAVAVDVLWALSGRRFGLCEVTVRPYPPRPVQPGLAQRAYAYTGIGGPGPVLASCPPAPARYLTLAGPVQEVTAVTIDGVDLDPGGYQLSGNRLYRLGAEPWPSVQDMTVAPGEAGSWTVAYVQGLAVPAAGIYAAQLLACELYKALVGTDCALPQRVTDITREGVSMTLLDPGDFLDKGRTGITAVDLWLTAVNPYHLAAAATVSSPDVVTSHPRI